ncbi:MAG: hypothetical protein IIB87_02680 [Chloroflexi bacterium]|nr:hypothetical protein [Chloroflexota bacterium]
MFGLVAAGVALGEAGAQGPEPSRAGMRSEVAGKTPPCPAEACMALTVKSGGTCADGACTVSTGEKFTLAVEIEVAPAGGYIAAQTWIEYGSDLTYDSAAAPADEIVWPGCAAAIALRSLGPGTAVSHGCLSGLIPPLPVSIYTGNFVELSFTCSSDPSSTMVRLVPLGVSPAGSAGTAFAEPAPGPFSNQIVSGVRDLTVNCAAPTATPTGTLTATPASSATPMPTGVATATPPGTPVGTPAATPTGGPTATPTFTTSTPGATPVDGATATPVTPAATSTATSEPSPTPTLAATLVGDANCDGNVDPIDAVFILQWSARLLAALPCPANADASENGIVDPLDAVLILQFSSGLIDTLPP